MSELPKGIRVRGNRLQMRIRRPGRGWEWEATGLPAHQLEAAARLRTMTQGIIDTGQAPAATGRITVGAYAKRWMNDRRDRGLRSTQEDDSRLKHHILGHRFGDRAFEAFFMDEVRPAHCRALIRAATPKLAPRTVINVNSLGRQLFLDAVADELIPTTPWAVPRKELPKKRDADPEWRGGALFTPAEIRSLLWAADEQVPPERRVLYALEYFGAMRAGEASARRWRDRLDTEPLRAWHIHSAFRTKQGIEDEVKTQVPRRMPEHPTLTRLLNEWKLSGFAAYMGRPPTNDDLVVPAARGGFRRSNHTLEYLKEDLERLGLRPRRQHDLRRAFISHAVDAGASRERLKPGTHGLGSSVLELYDTPTWKACCDEVSKLHMDPPTEVTQLTAVAGMGRMGTGELGSGGSGPDQPPRGGRKVPKLREPSGSGLGSGHEFDSHRLHHSSVDELEGARAVAHTAGLDPRVLPGPWPRAG